MKLNILYVYPSPWIFLPDPPLASSAYQTLHAGSLPFEGANLTWKTWVPMKAKLFL